MPGSMPKILGGAAIIVLGFSVAFVNDVSSTQEHSSEPVRGVQSSERRTQPSIDPYNAPEDPRSQRKNEAEEDYVFGEPMADADSPEYDTQQADGDIPTEDAAAPVMEAETRIYKESPMKEGVVKSPVRSSMAY